MTYLRNLIFIGLCLLISFSSFTQCLFEVDNNGFEYSVDVDLSISDVLYTQSGSTCLINIVVDYDITIDVTTAPSWWNQQLYTLQANFDCIGSSGNSFFDLPNAGGSGSVTSATFSFSNMDCEDIILDCPITLTISGPELNETSSCGAYSETTLPIRLTYFEAEANNQEVEFNWSTSSEINFSHFELQWSNDSYHWETIADIAGSNRISGSSYFHTLARQSGSYFARLAMVDKDGTTSYSEKLVVHGEKEEAELYIYPNPSFNTVYIENISSPTDVKIYSLNRKLELEQNEVTHNLDISLLPSGQYVMELMIDGNNPQYKKLIKF